MRKNGLQKAFLGMVALFITTTLSLMFWSCESNKAEISMVRSMDSTVTPVVTGFVSESGLSHSLDTARKTVVADNMTSWVKIWQTKDGVKDKVVFDDTKYPLVEAYSTLERDDYNITRDQVDIVPTSIDIVRAPETKDTEGHVLEHDTVIAVYPDAQVERIPVKITKYTVEFEGQMYYYPSVTLKRADFVWLKNTPVNRARTRGSYVAETYRTEYKMNLVFDERNKRDPEEVTLPIYAYATRNVMEDDDVSEMSAENKTREPINETDESCKFELIKRADQRAHLDYSAPQCRQQRSLCQGCKQLQLCPFVY